jgi:hypothetical protein
VRLVGHFDGAHVARLAAAVLAATAHRPLYGQREDGLTEETTPPALWIVKDEGFYLMSNGVDHHMEGVEPAPEGGWICYAAGMGPDDPWIGGDDFGELCIMDEQLEQLAASVGREGASVIVTVTDYAISTTISTPVPA